MVMIVFCLLLSAAVFSSWLQLRRKDNAIPTDLPWAGGDGSSLLVRVKLYLRSVLDSHGMLEEGHNQYSRHGRPFVFANLFTGAEIMLPSRLMDLIHDQPETTLSSFEAHREFMRADYTFLHPTIFHEHVFAQAIKIQLTRQLDVLTPQLENEAEQVFQDLVAASCDGWFELNDHASWKKIVLRVVSRIYVGKALCRDQDYLTNASTFNDLSMLVAAIIGLIPTFLQPLLAPLVCLRDKYYHRRCAAKTKPIIKERLHLCAAKGSSVAPNDLITWAVEDALHHSPNAKHKQTPDFLAARISMMNFVSIDSTSITIENVLYDILTHPHSTLPNTHNLLQAAPLLAHLRAEAHAAHAAHPSSWKGILNRLPLLDACLKESFRLNNFISRTNVRKVMSPTGLAVPGVGLVPPGVNIGFPLWGMHHDEDVFPDPYQWRMTRWLDVAQKEKLSVFGGGGGTVAAASQYLPFGYRRHACPGRFFALRVVKLILLQLLLYYDIDMPNPQRPSNPWLGVSRGPPMGGKLRFRKMSV